MFISSQPLVLTLATQPVLLETLKQFRGCIVRVSLVLECSENVKQINGPFTWLDANLRIQEPSCALLKNEMTSRCAILLDILCAELLDQHSIGIGECRVREGELRPDVRPGGYQKIRGG